MNKMFRSETVFSEITCPSGLKLIVVDGKGSHYFRALFKNQDAKEKATQAGQEFEPDVLPYLLAELLYTDQKEKVTAAQLKEMDIADITYIFSVVGLQLNKLQE